MLAVYSVSFDIQRNYTPAQLVVLLDQVAWRSNNLEITITLEPYTCSSAGISSLFSSIILFSKLRVLVFLPSCCSSCIYSSNFWENFKLLGTGVLIRIFSLTSFPVHVPQNSIFPDIPVRTFDTLLEVLYLRFRKDLFSVYRHWTEPLWFHCCFPTLEV